MVKKYPVSRLTRSLMSTVNRFLFCQEQDHCYMLRVIVAWSSRTRVYLFSSADLDDGYNFCCSLLTMILLSRMGGVRAAVLRGSSLCVEFVA